THEDDVRGTGADELIGNRNIATAGVAHVGRRHKSQSVTGRSLCSNAGKDDVPGVVQAEAGVVCDLPRVPVEIAKSAGVSAVERVRGLVRDLGAARTSLLDHLVHLFLRTDVV